jgi:hypothetical protein
LRYALDRAQFGHFAVGSFAVFDNLLLSAWRFSSTLTANS